MISTTRAALTCGALLLACRSAPIAAHDGAPPPEAAPSVESAAPAPAPRPPLLHAVADIPPSSGFARLGAHAAVGVLELYRDSKISGVVGDTYEPQEIEAPGMVFGEWPDLWAHRN